jgi:hypothetical protein
MPILENSFNSEYIVAINRDPAAAIFQVADICIAEDLTTFIFAFIEVYEKNEKRRSMRGFQKVVILI